MIKRSARCARCITMPWLPFVGLLGQTQVNPQTPTIPQGTRLTREAPVCANMTIMCVAPYFGAHVSTYLRSKPTRQKGYEEETPISFAGCGIDEAWRQCCTSERPGVSQVDGLDAGVNSVEPNPGNCRVGDNPNQKRARFIF